MSGPRDARLEITWSVRDDGVAVVWVDLRDLYCAIVSRVDAGDLATAAKYARWFMQHPDLRFARRAWIANALAVLRAASVGKSDVAPSLH